MKRGELMMNVREMASIKRATVGRVAAVLSGAALCAACGVSAWAAPINTKDSADFKYRWDFNLADDGGAVNDNFDLYDNTTGAAGADGVNDWFANTNGTTITTHDGILDLNNAGNRNVIWTNAPDINPTSGYTLEYNIHITSTAEATNGRGLVMDSSIENAATGPDTGYSAVGFKVNTTNPAAPLVDIHWAATSLTAGNYKTSVPFNSSFFTIRVTGEYDASRINNTLILSLYVNDVLIQDNINPALADVNVNRLYLAITGTGHGGQMELDYLSFTPGAFAPVPEPGAVSLVGAGGLLLLARRREKLTA